VNFASVCRVLNGVRQRQWADLKRDSVVYHTSSGGLSEVILFSRSLRTLTVMSRLAEM